jgi:hypothetical protein
MHHAEDISHISQRLEVGRKALETLATIASQLENAKDGLIRSAYLTSNIEELPPAVRRLWESLDKNIMAMSAKDLGNELLQIEQHLAVRLVWLTPFIEKICDEETVTENQRINEVRLQLQDMARLAGTALAMRMLAHRKNFNFPPSQLPIKADDLRDKAQRVKKIERTHKLKVITHMREMTKATTEMLQTPNLDAATRMMLKGVLHDLQLNAKHLANGGSFTTLPTPIEMVEMNEPESEATELALVEDNPVGVTLSVEHLKETASLRVAEKPLMSPPSSGRSPPLMPPPAPVATSRPASTPASTSTSVLTPKLVPAPVRPAIAITIHTSTISINPVARFFLQLYIWMTTPTNVSWSEARLMVHEEDDL